MGMRGGQQRSWPMQVLLAAVAIGLSLAQTASPVVIAPPSLPSHPGPVLPIGHSKGVDTVAFSPDGKLVASGGPDATVLLWEVQTGTVLRTLAGYSDGATRVFFSRATRVVPTLGPITAKTPQ